MKSYNRIIALLLAFILFFSLTFTTPVNAADKSVSKVIVKNSLTDSTKVVYVAKGYKVKLKTIVTTKSGKKIKKKALKKVKYKSANKKIATVSKDGVITGIKAGKTKITVTSLKNPKKKATIKVIVKKSAVESVSIEVPNSGVTAVGDSLELKATVSGKKNAYKKIRWVSSDESVATVSNNGVVTAKKVGKVYITARALDGSDKQHEVLLFVTSADNKIEKIEKINIEGKYILTKIIKNDGTILQGNNIPYYEEFEIIGNCVDKLHTEDGKSSHSVFKLSNVKDNTYDFLYDFGIEKYTFYHNVLFDEKTMTIVDGNTADTYIYTKQ